MTQESTENASNSLRVVNSEAWNVKPTLGGKKNGYFHRNQILE